MSHIGAHPRILNERLCCRADNTTFPQELARSSSSVDVPAAVNATTASETTVAMPSMSVPKASLWCIERPSLYSVTTTLTYSEGQLTLTDVVTTTIGVRTASWSAQTGFSLNLNGVPTKILGAAMCV